MDRRQFVASLGTVAVTGIAGCSSGNQTDSSNVSQPFPIKSATANNGDIELTITSKQDVGKGGSNMYRRASQAHLLAPDGSVDDRAKEIVPEQTRVIFTPDSGVGTYTAVLQNVEKEGDDDDGHVAAAKVQYSESRAVLVDEWYREYQ